VELFEADFEVFDDFLSENIRGGKVVSLRKFRLWARRCRGL